MALPIINKEYRLKGCSDTDAKAILDFFISVDAHLWVTTGTLYRDIEDLLYDEFTFIPIIEGHQDFSKAVRTRLPNAIYRKLIVYTIIHISDYNTENIHKIMEVFTHLEEAAITGFNYISLHGKSIHEILPILIKYGIQYNEVLYSDYLKKNKLDRGISIHNTMIVSLCQALVNTKK